jgi:hypothetical protein
LILVDMVVLNERVSTLCVYINVLKLTEISVRALFFNLVLIEFPDELRLGLCVCI